MTKNIILCGVGGQGTVLASRVLAQAAMNLGKEARTAETIGMAQRGGCVVSHVRIGKGIHSALVPQGSADLMLAFEPAEAVRNLSYLKEEALVIVSGKAVQPVTAAVSGKRLDAEKMTGYLKQKLKNIIILDTESIILQCGSEKVLNVALLGAAAKSGAAGIGTEQIKDVLRLRLPEKALEMNYKALELGGRFAENRI